MTNTESSWPDILARLRRTARQGHVADQEHVGGGSVIDHDEPLWRSDEDKQLSSEVFAVSVLLARYALFLEDVNLGNEAEMPVKAEEKLGAATTDIGSEILQRAAARDQGAVERSVQAGGV